MLVSLAQGSDGAAAMLILAYTGLK